MAVLVAATVLIGTATMLNLALTLAVIRRLRASAGPAGGRGPALPAPLAQLVGRDLPEFTAVTTAGSGISRAELLGRPRLVAFMTATCAPCRQQAPLFAGQAGEHGLAVIAGEGGDVASLLELMPGVAAITGAAATALAEDLGVRAFPSIVHIDRRGRIVDAMLSVDRLAWPPATDDPPSGAAGPDPGRTDAMVRAGSRPTGPATTG